MLGSPVKTHHVLLVHAMLELSWDGGPGGPSGRCWYINRSWQRNPAAGVPRNFAAAGSVRLIRAEAGKPCRYRALAEITGTLKRDVKAVRWALRRPESQELPKRPFCTRVSPTHPRGTLLTWLYEPNFVMITLIRRQFTHE